MTKDDVIRLAREAGFTGYDSQSERLHSFAELIKQHVQIEQMPKFEELAKIVREDCARMCDELERPNLYGVKECAAAIRGRI